MCVCFCLWLVSVCRSSWLLWLLSLTVWRGGTVATARARSAVFTPFSFFFFFFFPLGLYILVFVFRVKQILHI